MLNKFNSVSFLEIDLDLYVTFYYLIFQGDDTTLNLAYKCPSRSTLANQLIPAGYEQVKTQLVSELAGVKYVALTSDGWTSRVLPDDHSQLYTCMGAEDQGAVNKGGIYHPRQG